MLTNTLILNLKRNRRSLNLSKLNHKARSRLNKLKRKFNSQQKKKEERKRKIPNLHLKFLKSLFLKLNYKCPLHWLLNKSKLKRSRDQRLEKAKISLKNKNNQKNLQYKRKKFLLKSKRQYQKSRFQKSRLQKSKPQKSKLPKLKLQRLRHQRSRIRVDKEVRETRTRRKDDKITGWDQSIRLKNITSV